MTNDKQIKAIGGDGVPYGYDEWVNTPFGLGLVIATIVTGDKVTDTVVLLEWGIIAGAAEAFTRAVSQEEEEAAQEVADSLLGAMRRDR